MLLGEPPRTQADLNFNLLGIPVRVHPLFWAIAALLGIQFEEPEAVLLWVVVVFFSVLVHELGHALVAKAFGSRPWITLYALGGLASYDAPSHSWQQRVAVLLAGPGAGFAFAATVAGLVLLSGHQVHLERSFVFLWFDGYEGKRYLNLVIAFLFVANIGWSVLNLLPVYPLDGGQVARELLVQKDPWQGIVRSLWLSVIAAVAIAAYGLIQYRDFFLALMFGYLAYSSYMTLQHYQGRGRW